MKLKIVVVSTVALLVFGSAQAKTPAKPVAGSFVPNTSGLATATNRIAPSAKIAVPSSLKRSVFISLGKVEPAVDNISGNLASAGYGGASASKTDSSQSFSIGYRQPINSLWSVDASYINTGEVSASVETAPVAGKTPAETAKDVAKSLPIYGGGLNYVALRHIPVTNKVSFLAGAGGFIWFNEREATVNSVKHVEKDSGINLTAQLGLSVAITPRVSVEANVQRFFMPRDDVDRLSLGVVVVGF